MNFGTAPIPVGDNESVFTCERGKNLLEGSNFQFGREAKRAVSLQEIVVVARGPREIGRAHV